MIQEDEIRILNSDFNYMHYGQFNDPDADKAVHAKQEVATAQDSLQMAMLQKMW